MIPADPIQSDPTAKSAKQSSPQSSRVSPDFFSNLIGSIGVDPKQFVEKENGLYEMAQEETVKDNKETPERREKQESAKTKESNATQVRSDSQAGLPDELFTLDSPVMDRQFTLLNHIYGTIQKQLQQIIKSNQPIAHVRTLFQTQIGPGQDLDIQVQKQANTLHVTLYADPKLQAFLLDKIIALKTYLKKENPNLDDIELDIADREQRLPSGNPDIIRQSIQFISAN